MQHFNQTSTHYLHWMLKDALRNELFYGCLLVGFASLTVMPADGYVFTIAESLAFHFAIGLTVLWVAGIALRKWYFVSTVTIGLILLAMTLQPSISFQKAHASSPLNQQIDLKVTHLNVLSNNYDYKATMDEILDTRADIVSIQEVSYRWADKLGERMNSTYPHSIVIPRSDSFGIALFSKKPLKNVQVKRWGNLPNLTGQVEVDGQDVRFVTSHVPSPLRFDQYRQRQTILKKLRQHVRNIPSPMLAIGDLNAVSWGKDIQQLKQAGKLTDSRSSYASTYPSWLSALGIPIDYILHSDGLHCLQFSTFSSPSDHRGITGMYRLRHNHNLVEKKEG